MSTTERATRPDPSGAGSAGAPERPTYGRAADLALTALRVALGAVFLWAFVDKLFGWGYATPTERAWSSGGSPTRGFLSGVDRGPFETVFHGWAGDAWADWLFMLGLLAIGVALLLGVALRITAIATTGMMLLMWAAEWPLARTTSAGEPSGSTHPLVDYHLVYALAVIVLATLAAGRINGLGAWWDRTVASRLPFLE